MTKFDWERVRVHDRVRQHGAEPIGDLNADRALGYKPRESRTRPAKQRKQQVAHYNIYAVHSDGTDVCKSQLPSVIPSLVFFKAERRVERDGHVFMFKIHDSVNDLDWVFLRDLRKKKGNQEKTKKHSPPTFVCPICGKRKRNLDAHAQAVHPGSQMHAENAKPPRRTDQPTSSPSRRFPGGAMDKVAGEGIQEARSVGRG